MTTIASAPNVTVPDLSAAERTRLKNATVVNYDFVWRGLRRLGVLPNDVKDAAQEVFIVLASKIGDVAEGAEKSFLFQTVTRVAANFRRRQTRRSAENAVDNLDVHADPDPNPESLADMSGRLRLLDSLLAALDPDLRAVVILCELENMTQSEAAEALEIPPGTVASRLRRARAELSAAIATRGKSEP
ncbi:RNA polymerase sigma factor RpoE [Labilithrix luteola]|uniref:RNA polymerase sigma factor RpoE n=1 Tax=Labilithrix luteola TaxID=1391654 RepID=A0A0K1PXG1_9BACT|nr:RNA polymerase sigma factor RpoE [Labilithrix luteola]